MTDGLAKIAMNCILEAEAEAETEAEAVDAAPKSTASKPLAVTSRCFFRERMRKKRSN